MILRLFVLLIIAVVAVLAYDSSERQNSGLPLVQAAWSQPQQRRFLICPLDARQVPTTNERTA